MGGRGVCYASRDGGRTSPKYHRQETVRNAALMKGEGEEGRSSNDRHRACTRRTYRLVLDESAKKPICLEEECQLSTLGKKTDGYESVSPSEPVDEHRDGANNNDNNVDLSGEDRGCSICCCCCQGDVGNNGQSYGSTYRNAGSGCDCDGGGGRRETSCQRVQHTTAGQPANPMLQQRQSPNVVPCEHAILQSSSPSDRELRRGKSVREGCRHCSKRRAHLGTTEQSRGKDDERMNDVMSLGDLMGRRKQRVPVHVVPVSEGEDVTVCDEGLTQCDQMGQGEAEREENEKGQGEELHNNRGHNLGHRHEDQACLEETCDEGGELQRWRRRGRVLWSLYAEPAARAAAASARNPYTSRSSLGTKISPTTALPEDRVEPKPYHGLYARSLKANGIDPMAFRESPSSNTRCCYRCRSNIFDCDGQSNTRGSSGVEDSMPIRPSRAGEPLAAERARAPVDGLPDRLEAGRVLDSLTRRAELVGTARPTPLRAKAAWMENPGDPKYR